jgi:hypothetical protein
MQGSVSHVPLRDGSETYDVLNEVRRKWLAKVSVEILSLSLATDITTAPSRSTVTVPSYTRQRAYAPTGVFFVA